jgi:periplasmic divalent cation tolerance protein
VADILLVLTTAPEGIAETIARALVDERLAACVNVHAPMTSFYRWEGAIERDIERQLVIKTTRALIAAVEARVRELHSYELPEFLVVAVEDGSAAYIDWVKSSVR